MKRQTSVKWFSGVTAAVTAASFIGFVQTHSPEVNAHSNETEVSYTEEGDRYQSGRSEGRGLEFDANSGSGDQFEEQPSQGFEPSERRTTHS
ncbi:hypothetical protein [Pseudalkalibacillus hwajinpoensis]|uniref:hypothetical protein n=1 Tax=Guptibacillus hwajinpoensis TaxID=208199 RepID=UPI001CFEF26D|nr:hypothetical protein [Pseudalkalibacillus hwajinpoensis]